MDIKYQFFENENLFVQKFIGQFSIDDYIKYNRFIMEFFLSRPIKKILIDFREVSFNYFTEDFDSNFNRMVNIRKNIELNELKNREVNLIIWVDQPMPTVVTQLFINNFSKKNYNFCSTATGVKKMLALNQQFADLECIIENLDCQFDKK